ncbi:MAG TPA: nitroreductase family protein [Treponemataceae bacterium]|jgi:predicted oxidoreductase (fatty acid repression mutant protein)|nr:nitroreductase family protein [Treponemataceae bacterium]HOS35908.1 nitroreductase family protein [Treponemataceae bacterium]HRR02994.1 nitroreductase family protein [Treponemataceae bacterium]
MSTTTFYQAIEKRRSIYAIGTGKPVSENRVREIVEFAATHVPSAFNSQSARVVILFGKESGKFWEMVKDALRKIVPAEQFPKTEDKIDGFNAGWGTVLFFEDQAVVKQLMNDFSLYADNFPVWSNQSNGMLQFAVWTALQSEGLGSSLQHYNELVEEDVKKTWKLDPSWKLLAQMPFGSVEAPAGEKSFNPIEDRVKVFGH